jgi:hypothetical protein
VYESPPRRLGSWTNDRPGDFVGRQPLGPGLGVPGPDQGYVLKLVRQFEGQLTLAEGEHEDDAIHGCVPVALKRASLYGRAPVVHDLTVAFAAWGFLAEPDPALLELRRSLFEEVRQPHHYLNKRLIADSVPESTLRMTPAQVQQQVATNWRQLIQEPSAAAADSLAVVDDLSAADLGVPAPPSAPPVEEVVVEDVAIPDAALPTRDVDEDRTAAPAPPPSALNTADITELAAEAKEVLRNAPTAPGGPRPGARPSSEAEAETETDSDTDLDDDAVPEVDDRPEARQSAKPVAIPKDAEPDEVARLVAEAKQAFRRKPADDASPEADADDDDS